MNQDERQRLVEAVQSEMPERRWQHTLGVMKSSVELAKHYGGDEESADLAALLHDVAKYWKVDRQREWVEAGEELVDALMYDPSLWHAPAGACFAEKHLGITGREVLNAIRYHTTGRVGMAQLEKIVCLADYIEEGRQYPGVEQVREHAFISLEQGLLTAFGQTISFLIEQGKRIYPLMVLARNDILITLEASK